MLERNDKSGMCPFLESDQAGSVDAVPLHESLWYSGVEKVFLEQKTCNLSNLNCSFKVTEHLESSKLTLL